MAALAGFVLCVSALQYIHVGFNTCPLAAHVCKSRVTGRPLVCNVHLQCGERNVLCPILLSKQTYNTSIRMHFRRYVFSRQPPGYFSDSIVFFLNSMIESLLLVLSLKMT